MDVRQWTDEEWKKFETRFENLTSHEEPEEIQKLIKITGGQIEHPAWYESPCLCDECLSCE